MIIALNNKCNFTKEDFLTYQESLQKIKTNHQMILCPSNIFLSYYNLNHMALGSQNVSKTTSGAYTGEISAEQLNSFNVKYCIVGHSERRNYQQENNKDINEKIKRLFSYNITPILCIGETETERKNNLVDKVLTEELTEAIKELPEEQQNKIIIAYEPIWSIGTGIIPKNDEIIEVIEIIKKTLPQNKILYGGSVNLENIDELQEITNLDGYLLGGLSLRANNLEKFVKKLKN